MAKKKRDDNFKREMGVGIVFGLLVFVFTLFDILVWNIPQITGIFLDLYGKCGYDITWIGSILGLLYGFITGYLVTMVYNWFFERV